MPCYGVDFEVDGTPHFAMAHGDEVPTDPETIKAIQAVCKAAYEMMAEQEPHES